MLVESVEELPGVRLIKVPSFKDHRGEFVETWNWKEWPNPRREDGRVLVQWCQDDISISNRGVLRGIHGDDVTWKLVSCIIGEVWHVVCDPRTFKWKAFHLSEGNRAQVLIPPGYGNAHLVLSERAIFTYKQSTYYDRERQWTIKYNDPRFGIAWPVVGLPILSERDK